MVANNVDNQIQHDGDYPDEINWGTESGRSGYVFADNASLGNVTLGTAFTVGTFTHNNFPINSGTSITAANLKVTFNVLIDGKLVPIDHTINFAHDETPNSDNPPDDIVTFANDTQQTTVLVGERSYTLSLGFLEIKESR